MDGTSDPDLSGDIGVSSGTRGQRTKSPVAPLPWPFPDHTQYRPLTPRSHPHVSVRTDRPDPEKTWTVLTCVRKVVHPPWDGPGTHWTY